MKNKALRTVVIILGIVLLISVVMMIGGYFERQKENYINLSAEQKEEDIQYLHDTLEKVYPFWYEVEQKGINRDEIFAEYQERVRKAGTDKRVYENLRKYLGQFDGLGHLGIMSSTLYYMHADTYKENADTYKENADTYQLLLDVLENAGTMKAYETLSTFDEEAPASSEQPSSAIETRIIDEQTAYVKIPSFLYQSMAADRDALFSFYEEINGMDHLIIDIRGNSGGSGLYWQDLIVKPNVKENMSQTSYALFRDDDRFRGFVEAEISSEHIKPISELPTFSNPTYDYQSKFTHFVQVVDEYPAAENPFQGKIWVLVDEAVYSSSENFSIFCKDTGFATLVGQNTGGDGGLMNPVFFSLPNSGLLCRFSYLYRLNHDGSSNELVGTIPDISVGVDTEDSLAVCLAEIQHLREPLS